MSKLEVVDLEKRRAAALRHWERCFLDGTVDDQHGEFIAGILAGAGKKPSIPATYYGITSEECRHLIISYLEFSQFGKLIEEHPNGYDALAPFEAWWNEYISEEDSFLEQGEDFCQACEDGTCSELTANEDATDPKYSHVFDTVEVSE